MSGNRKTMRVALATILCASLAIVAVSSAQAGSALDQYVEQVPGIEGMKNHRDGNTRQLVPPAVTRKLASHGHGGKQLLAFVQSGVPPSDGTGAGSDSTGASSAANPNRKAGDSGPSTTSNGQPDRVNQDSGASRTFGAAVGATGINASLLVFLVLLAAGMGALGWYRRFRS